MSEHSPAPTLLPLMSGSVKKEDLHPVETTADVDETESCRKETEAVAPKTFASFDSVAPKTLASFTGSKMGAFNFNAPPISVPSHPKIQVKLPNDATSSAPVEKTTGTSGVEKVAEHGIDNAAGDPKPLFPSSSDSSKKPKYTSIFNIPTEDLAKPPSERYLFAKCIRCPSMVRIKFSSKIMSLRVVALMVQCSHGIVLTICRSCDSGGLLSGAGELSMSFAQLRLHSQLMEGSSFMKAAALVSGVEVPMITGGGHVRLETRESLWETTLNADEVVSVDITQLESQDVALVLKSHLRGGFF